MHDAGYAASGLDFKYVALGADDIEPVVQAVRTLGVRGLGVSMPHKLAVIPHLDEVTEAVNAIGACNTVVNDDGRLTGHNTDWQGAWRALSEAGLSGCRSALVVGAGGVARAVAYALASNGVSVTVAARNLEQAETLREQLGLEAAIAIERQAEAEAELLVNATPTSSSVVLDGQAAAIGVLDVVFQTRSTVLTRAALARGLGVASGWRMLLHQGAAQFELYTAQEAPLVAMAAVLEAALPGE